MKPKYTHDCDACTFLGQFVGRKHSDIQSEQRHYDLYICNDALLARYGNRVDQYLSWTCGIATASLPIKEAERLARERGLVKALTAEV